MFYMSYVQAAVCDAVTKIEGRYQPYHDFTFTVVRGAAVQAAAAQTILDHQYNVTMQGVATQHSMDLVDAAHLFAMGNIVTTDAGIACFDSKFFYQFWRPITAIQNADKDGNPDTTADSSWQALLGVPGHPEYPSQHGCFSAAFSDSLAAALRTQHLDVTMPGGQNGSNVLTTTQHFGTVQDSRRSHQLERSSERTRATFTLRNQGRAGAESWCLRHGRMVTRLGPRAAPGWPASPSAPRCPRGPPN